MAGISLGGLLSTYAACRYPHIFTKVAAISSAFYRNQEDIEKLLRDTDLSAIAKFYMDCGTAESGDDRIDKGFLESNHRVFDILTDTVEDLKFEIIEGAEHNYTEFRKRVSEIITYLFIQP